MGGEGEDGSGVREQGEGRGLGKRTMASTIKMKSIIRIVIPVIVKL